jgi:glycosyltransferase involved in cell wall biosynthesis
MAEIQHVPRKPAEQRTSKSLRVEAPLAARVNVILVGNYPFDQQESMQRFANLLVAELPKLGVDVTLVAPRPLLGLLKPSAVGLGKWLGYLDKFLVFPFSLRRAIGRLRRSQGDGGAVIVHICDHSSSPYVRYLHGVAHLVTCHDLLAIRMARDEFGSGMVGRAGRQYQRIIANGLRRAGRIVCVSHSTKLDLVRLIGRSADEIVVLHNGLNHPYAPLPFDLARQRVSALLSQLRLAPAGGREFSYILHVGGNHWYKNRAGVLRIYASVRAECQRLGMKVPKLIAAGPRPTPELLRITRDYPEWKDDFIFPGPVANEDLRALYSAAELLLFPSFEEGFGWPIVEAQACGCRVVTTGRAPMTEIGGEAAVYLDPAWVGSLSGGEDPRRAAQTVLEVLTEDPSARASRVAGGLQNAARFSGNRMAEEYLRLYRELALPSQRSAS